MKLSIVGAGIGIVLGLLTIAGVIYNAGRNEEHTAQALRRLCEQIQVLQHVTVSEHPEYSPTIYSNKGCDE